MAKDFMQLARKRLGKEGLARAVVRRDQLKRQMLLRELREAVGMPQKRAAKVAGMAPSNLARLERQPDMQIATLRKVVAALGGKMEIIARFGDSAVTIRLPAA
jgi:DNA-binding XRE family transcriptional regulator